MVKAAGRAVANKQASTGGHEAYGCTLYWSLSSGQGYTQLSCTPLSTTAFNATTPPTPPSTLNTRTYTDTHTCRSFSPYHTWSRGRSCERNRRAVGFFVVVFYWSHWPDRKATLFLKALVGMGRFCVTLNAAFGSQNTDSEGSSKREN